MPYKPKVPCKHTGCPKLVPYGTKYCEEHEKMHLKKECAKTAKKYSYDEKRENAGKRGYDSRWQKARIPFLQAHPLCERCKAKGIYTKATVVDHIIPHKGNKKLFWDRNNWQALCKRCHDVKTITEDRKY